jgi:SLT domain-containing protein
LAVGGITQGETIARIGEQGKKEAVIPLESPLGRRALDKAGGGGIGSNEPVNVTLMVDGRKLAEIVANRQAEASRQGRF